MTPEWSSGQWRCLIALGLAPCRLRAPPDTPVAGDPEGRLACAIVRAAGQSAAGPDAAARWLRAQALPDPATLRGDPRAKRALWPRLRALRRDRAPR